MTEQNVLDLSKYTKDQIETVCEHVLSPILEDLTNLDALMLETIQNPDNIKPFKCENIDTDLEYSQLEWIFKIHSKLEKFKSSFI